ncbi:MAG: thioredoxin family protein [Robiginitomaculum sp.]|nr:thioredoxin family protein [Robiginitomaculum sp.]
MRNFLFICLALVVVLFAPSPQAAESVPVKSGRAVAQLVTSHDTAAPGQDLHIALSLRLEEHWHTYWRNAGGPGMPAEIRFEILEQEKLGDDPGIVTIGDIIWPLPEIISTGPIVSYAFEDRLLLPMPLHISKDAKPGQVIIIKAQASYLVCYEVCLPEMAELELSLVITEMGAEPVKDGRWDANISRTIKNAPKPENLLASAVLADGSLQVDIAGGELDFGTIRNLYFLPYEQDLIEASAAQITLRGDTGLRFKLEPSFGLADGVKNFPAVLAFQEKIDGSWQRRGIVVDVQAGARIDIGRVKADTKSGTKSGGGAGNAIGLWAALVGAFIGGLILNLMPCVFPVLSLKALGFARAAHEDRSVIRKHGWLYTAGVMLSFLTLAVVILALKAGGAGIGWGFQLQNPVLVGALALLFFVIALNLFGVFQIGGSVQNTGSDLATSGGAKGAFFTGVLAVVVATPCTAPFMAGALGFAFAQPALMLIFVFIALGAGFALPFLALSYAPGLLARLPKPGPWMDTFKQFLAFPMLAAAVWLVWVLSAQTGTNGVWRILGAMLLVGFAVWLWKYKSMMAKIALAMSVLLAGYFVKDLGEAAREQELSTLPQTSVWSPERVAELRADGHIVFVDFTAAWCITCKVNEVGAINKPQTQELFAKYGVKTLVADWTSRDDAITKELARQGRSGVPLYLVYEPGRDDTSPQILPQILNYEIIEKAVEKANLENAK